MNEPDKKKSDIGASVWLVTMAALALLFATGYADEIGKPATIALFTVHAAAMFFAFWYYSKAKGYWGIFGIALTLFSFIGLIILALLPDRHQEL